MKPSPPPWIERLLEKFIDQRLFNSVCGDLYEEYYRNLDVKGKRYANLRFFFSALGYMRYFRLLSFSDQDTGSSSVIWLSYFKASFRNLIRNKENTTISLTGLTVSFAAALAIFQYTHFESSYDQFNPDHTRIYRVSHDFENASALMKYAQTFYAAHDAFKEEIPEIESSTHFMNANGIIKKDQELFVENNLMATTPDFFTLFGIELVKGNALDLADPGSLMLSGSLAMKYFGSRDVLGRSLEVQNVFGQNWTAKVAGVFEDLPRNTHLQADIILSIEKLTEFVENSNVFGSNITMEQIKWRWLSFNTYVKIKPEGDIEAVTSKANAIMEKNREAINEQLNQEHSVWLQPVSSIHTTPGIQSEPTPTNDLQLIRLFQLIGLLILIIAWINYINITTARAVTRAKEVGIRKIMGSHRSQLRTQFLIEALMLNIVAGFAALLLLRPFYPKIEELVEVQFFTGSGYNLELLGYMGLMVLSGSLISGLYPAFVLSNYQPVQVLKGKLKYSAHGVILRRILVVLQLVFSLFLISSLFIVQGQMDFMINHNLGLKIDQTILLDSPNNEVTDEAYKSRIETLKNRLKEIPGVEMVAISTMVPGIQSLWRGSTENRNGEEAGIFLHRATIDEDYLDLYEMEFLYGRNFDPSFGSDKNGVVINELAARSIGFTNPPDALGEKIHFTGNQSFEIIGIVSNFYQRGVQFAYEPRTFQLDTALAGNFISIRFRSNNASGLSDEIEKTFTSAFPNSPFNLSFLDEVFQAQYDNEKRFRNLFTSFTSIALVVACLGLIGLASYLLNQKTKEVSIRKVMGARNSTLFFVLNREYLIISLASLALTVPISVVLMKEWLSNYANRIELEVYMFLIPFLMILGIILLITFRYTLKVINANPAVVLREDG